MRHIFLEVAENKIFLSTLAAWAIAQTIKVVIGVITKKRFDFRWFVGSGGMPSSHAAGAACLGTTTGLQYGFDSVFFALAAAFAIVIMFDAQGVRRATGRQARILNKITDDIYWQGRITDGRLRELVGHTPIEVIMGALVGILVGVTSYFIN